MNNRSLTPGDHPRFAPNEAEAETVRLIFARFVHIGSATELARPWCRRTQDWQADRQGRA
ncbi:MAG: hypothetical protein H0T75_19150 [Rhizobiales bacterium]|nr:hypothetical protein [Hyphomicrobiales bacterium]